MEPAARLRASLEQFSALIEFMERHGDLSRPQPSAQGRIKGDRLWLQCAALLNSIGGGIVKSHDKWKKVWSDWKTKTKKKNLLIRQHASGTGGGPSSKLRLTALEERVVAVIGQTAVGGQIVPEHGVIEPSAPIVQPLAPVLEVPDIHLPLLTPSPPPPPPGPLAPPPGPALTPAPATSPPLPSPPSPPPTSPQLRNRHQQSTSPLSAAGTPRRRLLRARRNRGLTPFDQATSEFVAIEQRRLRFEERRETILHEREMERLRLEALRIENSRDHNGLLQQLGVIAQNLLHAISAVTQNTLPASTEIIIPDTD